MPTSPSGNEPGSPSGSDVAESEKSDSSSSDFEVQAVTSADGVRTNSLAPETGQSKKYEKNHESQQESSPALRVSNATNGTHSNLLGLDAYTDSSSSDEDQVAVPEVRQEVRRKKRVRFAEEPPEKRQRVEQRRNSLIGSGSSFLGSIADEVEDETAVMTELAEFEAAVADAGRNTDDIEADLADSEDAREEQKQRELENTVTRLREEFNRRKAKAKANVTEP